MPYNSYWGKRKYYGYRKGYGKKSKSVKAVTISKAFKASAANMTQNGLFNINVKLNQTSTITEGSAFTAIQADIANLIAASPMHAQLSNTFDQYRVEKISIKIRPAGNTVTQDNNAATYLTLFTAIDKSGFATQATLDAIRTYQSYKETVYPSNGDTTPTHYVNIGPTDIVDKSTYYDTKGKAKTPNILIGTSIVAAAGEGGISVYYSVEIDAQVRYRGIRLDTREVDPSA